MRGNATGGDEVEKIKRMAYAAEKFGDEALEAIAAARDHIDGSFNDDEANWVAINGITDILANSMAAAISSQASLTNDQTSKLGDAFRRDTHLFTKDMIAKYMKEGVAGFFEVP